MNEKVAHHHTFYIIEFAILGIGFYALSQLSSVKEQLIGLTILLGIYILLGLFHHKANHTLKKKIVLEYILISTLILSAFLFINSARF